MNDLHEEGFKEQFKIINAEILAISEKKSFKPEALKIMDKYRFDGMTNPSDESILYALQTDKGLKGTLVVAANAKSDHSLIKEIPTNG